MPRGPQGQYRPGDLVGCATHVAKIATGEISEFPKLNRVPARKAGGIAGGKARAKSLSPQRRRKIATKAASARWRKHT